MADRIKKTYQNGTLKYTQGGLFFLFIWLMFGDFCYTMESSIDPSILPFFMKKFHSPNTLIALVVTIIPSALNFVLNPIISTYSDRYRSKLGRRIPFLIAATPFISLFLVLIGFSEKISGSIYHNFFANSGVEHRTIALGFLLIVTTLYRISFLFVGTTFFYLFNDVVPEEVMGRFTTGFRIFGLFASMAFGVFGFKYVESHPEYLCMIASALYLVGFGMMCIMVKEGEYPPPLESLKAKKPIELIKMYIAECCTDKIYIHYFIAYGFFTMILGGCASFLLLMFRSTGVSFQNIGYISAITSGVSFLVLIPAGYLSDKYHPIRVFLCSMVANAIIFIMFTIWAFVQTSGNMLPLCFAIQMATLILGSVAGTALFPLGMRLVPRQQYGQYSAAGAMVSSLMLVVGGFLIGQYMDIMKNIYNGNEFYYRYILICIPIFSFASLIAMNSVYKKWLKLGGDKGYNPPIHANIKIDAELDKIQSHPPVPGV